MASSASQSRAAEAAYLEEYNEEAQTTLPGTRRTANITAKRSKPNESTPKSLRDEFSDSGYSSHTIATLGSTDSSLESKTGLNPLRVDTGTAAIKKKPTTEGKKPQSRRQSPEKPPLSRVQSKSWNEEAAQPKQCSCTECVAKVRRSNVPVKTSHHHTGHVKSHSKQPAPVLPQSTRPPPAQIMQDAPILPQPRPRPPTAQSYHRARPMSFHGGPIPDLVYQAHGPLYIERPSPRYPPTPVFPPPSYPPQTSYFPTQQPVPQPQDYFTSPLSPFETQPRPRPQRWTSEHPTIARPQSMVYPSSPIIEYPVYPVIAPSTRPSSRQTSRRERPIALPDEHPARDEDYYNMPPPPSRNNTKSRQETRPAMKHANTVTDSYQAHHSRRSGREESIGANVGHRSLDKQSYGEHDRARRPSMARPSRTSDEKVSSTHTLERHLARMTIESSAAKERRRSSVYDHESLHDLEGSVEAYQAAQRNNALHASSIDALVGRKKANTSSSSTSSRHSEKSEKSKNSREGSDIKSRRTSSDVKNRHENDKFAMRFNASQGFNLNINGDARNGTINLRQVKDEGDMELNIGVRGRAVGSRPTRPASEEKTRRRNSSYIDGEAVKELERSRTTSRAPKEKLGDYEPQMIREHVTTTSRSRRSSRSGYSGRGQAG